jgi:hypothetical protein
VFDINAYRAFKLNSKRNTFLQYIDAMRPGIIVIETSEEFLEIAKNDTYASIKRNNKYCEQHFPSGTLVTINPFIYIFNDQHLYPSVFTVKKVIAAGRNNFILETDTLDMNRCAAENEYFKFNISHVESILLRGDKMSVEPHCSEVLLFGITPDSRYDEFVKRGHWLVNNMYGLVYKLTSEYFSDSMNIRKQKIANDLLKQSFVKVIYNSATHEYVYRLNKKRTKRFIKQNKNRYTLPFIELGFKENV